MVSDQLPAWPFILPSETLAPPDVSPLLAPAGLGRALFEGEPFARRVGGDRVDDAEQRAQIVEVALRRRPLLELDVAPLGRERVRGHRTDFADRAGAGKSGFVAMLVRAARGR